MTYYYPPTLPVEADLNVGFEDRYIERDQTKLEHLDNLLLCLHHQKTLDPAFDSSVDFITWRGIINKVRKLIYTFPAALDPFSSPSSQNF